MRENSKVHGLFGFVGNLGIFAFQAVRDVFTRKMEFQQVWLQLEEVGWRSSPLIVACGLALGVVMTLHTRSTLAQFGAAGLVPSAQAQAFLGELGPLIVGLLVAGRVGSGIGAELANMRVTEQIDALETFSIESFNFLVVPRILACIIAMPILTTFMNTCGLVGGYIADHMIDHISLQLYMDGAFGAVVWSNFIPPTMKTAIFGFIIGVVSCYYGYTINEGARGVRKAATKSVVFSSLLIILADIILVKLIFFFYPDSAI